MKERPTPFSAPMVRAILEGRKTQTRRVIKPQPYIDDHGNFCWNGSNFGQDFNGPHIQAIASPIPSSRTKRVLCPYGKPGDRLWVREAFRTEKSYDHIKPGSLPTAKSGSTLAVPFWHAADFADGHVPFLHAGLQGGKLRPPMFMPRAASRILLEITGVRVERLQDISEADAVAEGVTNSLHMPGGRFARENFEHLWWTINGDGSWEANPWVWVVEFKRVTP